MSINKQVVLKKYCLFVLAPFFVACTSLSSPLPSSLPSTSPSSLSSSASHLNTVEQNIASEKQLDVPFFPQQQYQCGPAALASILNFYGVNSSPDDLAKQIFIPEKKGSLQLEVIAASRRADMLPYPLSGEFKDLLAEVNAGHPVVVLQNLGFNWLPKWHYAVVVGYELNTQTIILHSGTHKNYRLSFRTFLNTWNRANNWALVVLPVNEMPASVQQDVYVKAATSLESTGNQAAAFQAYQQALNVWPNNEVALFGVGNFFYEQSDYEKSLEVFLHLVQAHPANSDAWNNFAYVLQKNNCSKQAQQAIEKALSLTEIKGPYLDSQQELKQSMLTQNKNNALCDSIIIHTNK